ncbi:hypothetical protein ILYODFUR_009663 [Ilyodon furcidens]|uniref:Uncharacterized protein n=1 Tax=Ilyodon furcidens TaxID=33524 RepID=A0ABV0SW02_9TELE
MVTFIIKPLEGQCCTKHVQTLQTVSFPVSVTVFDNFLHILLFSSHWQLHIQHPLPDTIIYRVQSESSFLSLLQPSFFHRSPVALFFVFYTLPALSSSRSFALPVALNC